MYRYEILLEANRVNEEADDDKIIELVELTPADMTRIINSLSLTRHDLRTQGDRDTVLVYTKLIKKIDQVFVYAKEKLCGQ